MRNHNGHALVELIRQLFCDLKQFYPELEKELARDLATISRRVESESISFLTKTLPRFGKAIDKALSSGGRLLSTDFHKSGKSGLPAFLRGFLVKVFDVEGGVLANADPGAVRVLRQVCYIVYKLEVPYDSKVKSKKVKDFVELDESLPLDFSHLDGCSRRILARAQAAITFLFRDFSLEGMLPKHGPGAVAGGEKPWEKMNFSTFYATLDEEFSYPEWFFLSPTHLADELSTLENMVEKEPLSVLRFVPKDSRGPRLIAMEPLELMWIQQGIKSRLYSYIQDHPMTKGHINFDDQMINRRLALEASIDGRFHTLDLKDASDSVSMALVDYLFKNTDLLPKLRATRSVGVVLPDATELRYRKFAPMGSALCFPLEALCFWALILGIIGELKGDSNLLCAKSVYIYGDDIILPEEYSSLVRSHLPIFALKLNEDKCCVGTQAPYFRESCGMDAFAGEDVTPIKVKHLVSEGDYEKGTSKSPVVSSPTDLVSMVEYGNAFHRRGYTHVASFFRTCVEGLLGPLPPANGRNPLAWESDSIPELGTWTVATPRFFWPVRWNKDLQRIEIRSWAVCVKTHVEPDSDGWNLAFRSIISGFTESDPLVTPVPRAVVLRKKWLPFV